MQAGAILTLIGNRLLDALWPERKTLASLRSAWGSLGDKRAWLESDYFDLVRRRPDRVLVDDRTWLDLEYPRIFGDMDTTITPIGSQLLFHQLRRYPGSGEEPRALYETCEILRSNAPLRERIQLRLKPLEDDGFANIAGFLLDNPPEKMRHRGLIALWGLASLVVLSGVIAQGWPLWIWLGMLAINVLVILKASGYLFRDAHTLKGCVYMMQVAERVAGAGGHDAGLPMLERLRAESANRQRVRKSLMWFAFVNKPLVSWIVVWLNLMFLLETSIYNLTIERFVRVREALLPTFVLLGELDACIAIASYLQRHREHCRPAWTDDGSLELMQARHPLIEEPVANSIALARQSVLVTGSNMAGKTTFIKTVAIQLLFGQTLGFCLASEARIPRIRVMASIRGEHSVASGKSHYFAEVEAIRSFIDLHERGVPAVFVIDELFSGTNTVERIAAARAVLECLSRRATVLVTTHDVELQSLIPEQFILCHFQENPDIDGFFDYRLRPGRANGRNAIRLLQRMGFPDQVVANAMAYTEEDPQPG